MPIAATLLLIFPAQYGDERFPQLRVFMPIIQSHGACSDRIGWTEGDQPYGGIGDYRAILAFYTNRRVEESPFTCASETLPEWLIAGETLLTRCPGLEKQYGTKWRYGKQFLLYRKTIDAKEIDLTSMANLGKAVKDCENPEPKRTRYTNY